MAVEIFNRSTVNFSGSFAAHGARLIVAAGGAPGGRAIPIVLVQRMVFAYQQQVTRLYELSSNAIYRVGGRAAGDASMHRMFAPKAASHAFFAACGDICNVAGSALNISFPSRSGNTADALALNPNSQSQIMAKACVLTAIRGGVTAMSMIFNDSAEVMFNSLEYNGV